MLASTVDFPDATGPTMPVNPGRMVMSILQSVGSGASGDQEISAPSKHMRAGSEDVDGSSCPSGISSGRDSTGDIDDGGDIGRFAEVSKLRYTSIRPKHAAACMQASTA